MALSNVESQSGVGGLPALGSKNIADIFNGNGTLADPGLVKLLISLAGLFLLFYLVAGGFGMMTSKGDPKAVEAAKGKITTAFIGFVIIAIGYLLVQLLGLIFGLGNFGGIF